MRLAKNKCGFLLGSTIAVLSVATANAQTSGPLDQVRQRITVDTPTPMPGRYAGPLDHGISQLESADTSVAAPKLFRPSPLTPMIQQANHVAGAENRNSSVSVRSQLPGRLLPSAQVPVEAELAAPQQVPVDVITENYDRPQYEESMVTPSVPVMDSVLPKDQMVIGDGTMQDWLGSPAMPSEIIDPRAKHGVIGYRLDFGYRDGEAFGHNLNRLYHPLETPTTFLTGSPTVLPGFGACVCDEWEGFCRIRCLDYNCRCGGLKAFPGHLGIPWLRGNDNCEETVGCGCRKCRPKRATAGCTEGCGSNDCGCN